MPYIDKKLRPGYDELVQLLRQRLYRGDGRNPAAGEFNPGQLNYIISRLIWWLFDDKPNYARANELLGVLEAVKQEFYRRRVGPYEDGAIKRNGDLP
jgi:hypothetical protein